MLYNRETKTQKKQEDCFNCQYFDHKEKKCKGIGKNCFEYDPVLKKAYDPITKLPIKL